MIISKYVISSVSLCSVRRKNIAQSQKAGFSVFRKFLTANKNGFSAGKRAFGFFVG